MRAFWTALVAATLLGLAAAPPAQAQIKAEPILTQYRPSLKGVEYDTPATPEERAACTVEEVKDAKGATVGYAVRDAQGKLLRRFLDANGKATQRGRETKPTTHLDQWSYFHDGFEVYREIDANEDGSVDEVRWLNAGGTRVADVRGGKVLAWRRLSPEEATRVMVEGLVADDPVLVATVVATADELKTLGLPESLQKAASTEAQGLAASVPALKKQLKGWVEATTWSRFDGQMPHVIPGDPALGLAQDVVLYENGVVFVSSGETADPQAVAYLHVPELVKVGETWKFVGLPRAVDPAQQSVVADASQGSLRASVFGESPAAAPGTDGTVSAETIKAIADYDKTMPGAEATDKELAQWHLGRIEVLRKAIGEAKGADEKVGFYKQVVHDLSEAYRTGLYPQGAEVFEKLIGMGGKVGSFAEYRKILAEFDIEAEKPGGDNLQKAQDQTVAKLEAFLEKYPQADEVPDVLFQIANVYDFNADEDKARAAFARLAKEHPTTDVGKKAAGALTRLDLDGKPLSLAGPTTGGSPVDLASMKGKTVLVLFWMSLAEPDRREIGDLLDLYKKYQDKGFAVLSVNLDADRATLDAYLKETSLPWPVIFEGGGLDGALANSFGIVSTPTMFLVDGDGKVVSHRIRRAAEVEKALEKPLAAGGGAEPGPVSGQGADGGG